MPNVTATPKGLLNGEVVTEFTDTTGTASVTYTYPVQQAGIMIENSGVSDINVTVGQYVNQVVKPDKKWRVDALFTSFSIRSDVNSQEFIATAFQNDVEGSGVADAIARTMANKPVTPKDTTFFDAANLNVFNKDSVDNILGAYVTISGQTADAKYNSTHKISVNVGDVINTNIISDGASFCGVSYRADGTVFDKLPGFANGVVSGIVIADSNIKFIRLNYRITGYNNSAATLMVMKNEPVPAAYTPYSTNYRLGNVELNDKQKNAINPLYNKIALFDGDSICYGAGYVGGYAKVIGDNNAMTYVNYGRAGGTIAGNTFYPDTTPRHWVSRSVASMQSNADYIIFQGGINDYWNTIPIGTITPDYVSAFDDTTFCGGLESLLKQAALKWPGKKIGFIISHKIKDTFYPYGAASGPLSEAYWDKARQICEKWSIPYLDLFKESGLNVNIPEINDAYFQLDGTGHGDRTHPNEAGYRQFLTPKIEAWMKSL